MRKFIMCAAIASFAVAMMGASPLAERKSLAPDFTIQDLEHQPIRLSDFRGKKPVVLFFWTTWCPYCLKELKHINSMADAIDKDGIQLISINVGEEAQKPARVVKNYELAYRVFADEDSRVADQYHVLGVPSFVLVDKKGFIRSIGNSFPYAEAKALAAEK